MAVDATTTNEDGTYDKRPLSSSRVPGRRSSLQPSHSVTNEVAMTSPNIDSDHKSEEKTPGRDWFLQLCERGRILPRLESDKHGGTPLGARPLTQDEEAGKSPVATDPAALALATDIAQRGFQWRDEETRRLADRAGLLLSAASVVIGLATAFGGAGFATNAYTKGLLIAAFGVYVILALLMVLALRPRPLRRDTGYAVD
jgi:hypothetical protein